MNEELRCLEESDECEGPVEYRPAPPYGERAFARCEKHQEARWDRYENSIEKYAHSDVIPDWFDPSIAGERWDDD